MRNSLRCGFLGGLVWAGAPTGEATAQASEAALPVVTITAQKRPQSALDVNASVAVIDADTISENHIQGVRDFFALVPNVNAQENGNGGPRTVTISMRGINDQGAGGERVAAVSAFAFYVDDLSVGNAATDTANPPLYDIEAIEVLRGPQGTYFGRNASGGAVNIRTSKPARKFFAQLDLGAGNRHAWMANGVLNVPLSETLALRQTLQRQREHGVVSNVHPTGGDSGSALASGRTSLRWLAGHAVTVDASFTRTHETAGIRPLVASGQQRNWGFSRIPLDASFIGSTGLYPDNRSQAFQDSPSRTANDSTVANLNVQWRLPTFELRAIAGVTRGRSDSYQDLDGSGLALIDRASVFRARSSSLELRASSVGARPVEWLAGAYGYADSNDYDNEILVRGVIFGWVPGDKANENNIHIRRRGEALFGDLSWHATPHVTLEGGARYSRDRDHQFWSNVYAANGALSLREHDRGVPLPGAVYFPFEGDFLRSGGRTAQTIGTEGRNKGHDFSPRLAINYRLRPDLRLYGAFSQGYKAAGVRANPDSGLDFPNVSHYRKERVTSYEAGMKGLLWGSTRFEAALFDMAWRDFQVHVNQTWCRLADGSLVRDTGGVACASGPIPVDRIVNAGKARSRGAELSWRTRLGQGFSSGGSLGLLHARFKDFKDSPNGDASGTEINGAPRRSASANLQWSGTVAGGDGFLRPEVNYRSSFRNVVAPASHVYAFGDRIPGRTLWHVRAGFNRGRANVLVGAENLFGKDYFTGFQESVAGRRVDVHPRSIMFRLTLATD
jgi:iron complex outermembrane recepter protein